MTARAAKQHQPDPAEETLTVQQVCDELDVPRSTFYQWHQTHKGPRCIRLPNGTLRVQRTDLSDWLDQLKDAA